MTSALPLPTLPAPPAPYVPAVGIRSARVGRTLLALGPLALVVAVLTSGPGWRQPLVVGLNFLYAYFFAAGLTLGNRWLANALNQWATWTTHPTRRLWLALLLTPLTSAAIIGAVDGLTVAGYRWSHHHLLFRISWAWNFWVPLAITSVVSVVFHASSFLKGWQAAAVRAERLEKERAVARLDSLRRQVDPHFLFNSLNALTALVEEEPARAVRFIRQLGEVYRYVLESQHRELVPLVEELAFAEAYVFLQKTRLGAALTVALPPALDTAGLYLPPLALQLLLENALKHNAAYQAAPLTLRVSLDAAAPALTVRNTLRPRRLAPEEVSGTGLANLRARYAFLTARPLLAGPVEREFVVTLPLLTLA